MDNKRRQVHNAVTEALLEQRAEYDGCGRTVINMTVKDDGNFLSPFSSGTTAMISSEVAEFIENSTHSLPLRRELLLRVHSDCIDETEREEYRAGIKTYYEEKYIASKGERRFNLFAVILLALAGIATLALAFNVESHIWSEVIDIAAWVFLWEAVDIGVFRNREIRRKCRRYLNYTSMEVEFLPLSSRNE